MIAPDKEYVEMMHKVRYCRVNFWLFLDIYGYTNEKDRPAFIGRAVLFVLLAVRLQVGDPVRSFQLPSQRGH